jgi:adenylosuccinate synthase
MINYADIIVDLQAGDTGKGKVAHHLIQQENEYTHVIRYNGGGNAGHTIYHNGHKVVTHFIPCGVLYGLKSIIGPGCVVNPKKLFEEIEYLESIGVEVKSNLLIDKRVHVITNEHLDEDGKDVRIGTTKQGIGPVYKDKYGRVGLRAEKEPLLSDYITDIYDLHTDGFNKILFEGAQGFELDIDWGDYPFVTSSHCTAGSAILNGIPPQKIRDVFGVSKVYRTYVGAKDFEVKSKVFDKIREIGNEYGATTGRMRQIDWLNLDMLIKAININGVSTLIFNKLDVLENVGSFNMFYEDKLVSYETSEEFTKSIINIVNNKCDSVGTIIFSTTPYGL